MGEELSKIDRRLINVIILGIILLVSGFATIFSNKPEAYIPLIIGGLFAILIGIIYFKRTKEINDSLSQALHDRIGREFEDDDDVNELSAIANEMFLKNSLKAKDDNYTYLFIEVKNPPKKAICMISRTTFEENEDALQCPNCENYFQKKYLIDWLTKNSNCPICQTFLKLKKT